GPPLPSFRFTRSEGLAACADQHHSDVPLVHPAVEQLFVDPDRTERPAASWAELEVRLERGLAPRALGDLDPSLRVEPRIGERVNVPLPVVPLDVLLLHDVEGGLVHPRLPRVEHVLEVVADQLPLIEV